MAQNTREIVTLQFGHYANFVGSHFWNAQELGFVYDSSDKGDKSKFIKEINHDVLFREGLTLSGHVTYTPRVVIVDLKGSLHTLRQEGALYDVLPDEDDPQSWSNDVTLHKTNSHPKNEFLRDLDLEEAKLLSKEAILDDEDKHEDDVKEKMEEESQSSAAKDTSAIFGKKLYDLDNQVNVWSDFLRPHLHPRTVCIVEDYKHVDDLSPFNVFGFGHNVMDNKKFRHNFEDSLHFFVEECDHLQGFQLVVDTYDGFAGLASRVVEELEDEFSSKAVFTAGVSPASFKQATHPLNMDRLINSLLAFDKLSCHSSLLLPLSMATSLWRAPTAPVQLPHINYKHDLMYHTSAILGAAVETLTLPWRRESQPVPLAQITDVIGAQGRKLACLQSSFPFPLKEPETLMHSLVSLGNQLPWQPLTPYCCDRANVYAQAVTVRGIPANKVKSTANSKMPRILQNCSTVDEVLQYYLAEVFPTSLNASSSVTAPSPVNAPYPHVFDSSVMTDGLLSDTQRSVLTHGVETVPMMTSLQSNASSGVLLEKLHDEASKINIKKFHKFLESGLEVDDYKESLDRVSSMKMHYD